METLLCDVIGCGCPAAWVHGDKGQSHFEDLLCQPCWAKLWMRKPHEAACYVPCDPEASYSLAASKCLVSEADREDVIAIGV